MDGDSLRNQGVMIFTQTEEFIDLCKATVRAWGVDTQLRLLQEECGECVAAVNHYYRRRDDAHQKLCSEVADVLLSAFQVRSILGEAYVDNEINNKLDRLKERLKDAG